MLPSPHHFTALRASATSRRQTYYDTASPIETLGEDPDALPVLFPLPRRAFAPHNAGKARFRQAFVHPTRWSMTDP
jgi:hypothetical protein